MLRSCTVYVNVRFKVRPGLLQGYKQCGNEANSRTCRHTHRNNTPHSGKGALKMSVIACGLQAVADCCLLVGSSRGVLGRVAKLALLHSGHPQIA